MADTADTFLALLGSKKTTPVAPTSPLQTPERRAQAAKVKARVATGQSPDEREDGTFDTASFFLDEMKKRADSLAAGAVSGIRNSATMSMAAGAANLSPSERMLANAAGANPALLPLVTMLPGYKQGTEALRETTADATKADGRGDPNSKTFGAGQFGGTLLADAPLMVLQPEVGAATGAKVGAKLLRAGMPRAVADVGAYLARQGMNIPNDMIAGALDQLARSGELQDVGADDVGLAFAARNVLGLLGVKSKGARQAERRPTKTTPATAPSVMDGLPEDLSKLSPHETHKLAERILAETGQNVDAMRTRGSSALKEPPRAEPNVASVVAPPARTTDAIFPRASGVVDGRRVRPEIPNQDSIDAGLSGTDYTVLPGVREVSIQSEFGPYAQAPLHKRVYAKDDADRVRALAAEIKASGEINPLIVGIDADGPYIIEGGHRLDALIELGAKSFPAQIVVEEGATVGSWLDDGVKRAAQSAEAPPLKAQGAVNPGDADLTGQIIQTPQAMRGQTAISGTSNLTKDDLGKMAEPSSINLNKIDAPAEVKLVIAKTADELAPVLARRQGKALSQEEVIERAAEATILRTGVSREATAEYAAQLHRTAQHITALAAKSDAGTITAQETEEMLKTILDLSSAKTSIGRLLSSFNAEIAPELYSAKIRILEKVAETGIDYDTLAKHWGSIDQSDARQVTKFFRTYVKPTVSQWIDEYRYINLLSSPKTHLTNLFSNSLQAGLVRPATKLLHGGIDMIGSRLTGRDQQVFMREVPAYARGVLSALPAASEEAWKALKGIKRVDNRDLIENIPTGSKVLAPFQFIPNALQAADSFFRVMITAGEVESLTMRAAMKNGGKQLDEAAVNAIQKQAMANAEELIFRKPLDSKNASGHGHLLSAIDALTGGVQQLRRVSIGKGIKPVAWFVPFVETPMNILKQGIEYSPAGILTLSGSTRKSEQLAKATLGSIVFTTAGVMALNDKTTWAVPRNKKDKEAFYAAGLQPFSVKLGDTWVSYSRLGPLAYPLAMAAAMKYYAKDAPDASGEMDMKALGAIIAGTAEYFGNQSYVQGMSNLMEAFSAEGGGMAKAAANLPTQMIPLSSLQRWITQIVDPVYRKTGSKLGDTLDIIKKGIPGLSQTLPAYETPEGEPSRRQFPLFNAFSPVNVTQETPAIEDFKLRQQEAQERARQRREDEENE